MTIRKFYADIDVEGKIITNSIKYNLSGYTGTFSVGERRWNNSVGTTELLLKGGNVTVQDGQEIVMYVYNRSGVDILNGKAVTIVGAENEIDVVELAIASDSGNTKYRVAGIATEDIPNNSYGFITVIGQIHDLNLSGFAEGEDVYLSQTSAGDFCHLSDLSISGRTIELGKVIKNASIDGVLRLGIHNEFSTSRNTLGETQVFTINSLSTGVFSFSGITQATSTTFDIKPVKGWIVDNETNPTNPVAKFVQYSGSTGNTSPYLNTNTQTFVLLNINGQIVYQTTYPTPTQRRQNIFLGSIVHTDFTNITAIGNSTDQVLSPLSQVRDMFIPIRLINGGVGVYPNGANMTINNTSEYIYGLGINFYNDETDPNRINIPINTPVNFRYRTQTGGTFTSGTTINPTIYDNGGVATSIAANPLYATNQRIYVSQEGIFLIQYGQKVYDKLADAIAGITTEPFVTYPPIKNNAILIGILSVARGATALNDTTQAYFTGCSKFGELAGGGGGAGGTSTATLQSAYTNSTNPEILTNSTLNGVTIRRGSAADTDDLINFENGAGVKIASITAEGRVNLTNIKFDPSVSGETALQGQINWNAAKGTVNIGMGFDSVVQQVGMEQYYPPVINRTGSGMTQGTVVMVNPSATTYNEKFNILRGIGNGSYSNKMFLGILTMDIADQEIGIVTKFGEVHDLLLSEIKPSGETWIVNDILYVHPTIHGGLTNIEPTAPNLKLACAVIQRIVGNSIDLFVRFENGYTLDELHNVHGVNKINGSTLIWNSGNSRWEALTATTLSNSGITTGVITSTVGNGTSPLIVSSQTLVNNLNANFLQGNPATAFSLTGHTHNYLPLTGGTLSGGITGTSFTVVGGTSAQFLKANGSLDSTIYLPKQIVNEAKDYTGFIDGNNISVNYNYTNRTVTLTGDLSYMWRGEVFSLTSPYTTTAHTTTTGSWFLMINSGGGTPTWSQSYWSFDQVLIAYVNYQASNLNSFCIRETHGLMDWKSHEEFHSQIGTYRNSGGQVTEGTYTENTPTDAANAMGFDAAVIKDEDLLTTVPAWIEGTYTTMYVSGNTSVFNTTSTLPFIATTNTYIQVNNPTTGAMTAGIGNRWYNVYQIIMPCASDVDSQKYRMIMLQPQQTFTSLAAAQAEDTRTLNLGSLSSISPEFIEYTRITYATSNADNNTGKCRIATGGITYVVGNKAGQINGGGFSANNHQILSNLSWLNSGHLGTSGSATLVATFSAAGVTTETEYTSNNVNNTIVSRDGSGNFSANIISANLTGLASSATTVTGGIQSQITSIPNLNTIGTVTGGTWNGNIIASQYGGTGINNGGRTLTINTNSGTLSFTSASTTLTIANNASVSGINMGDQTITLSGDVITNNMTNGVYNATLPNITTAGTYNTVVVNAKGQVTSATTINYSLLNHTHYQLYQPNGSNPFVYTDNSGTLHIDGNIVQNGSGYTVHAQDVYTTDNMIILRDGAVAGLGVGEYVGLTAKLYDGINDGQLVFDKDGWARVGDVGSLQKLATIEESPINNTLLKYDISTNKIVSATSGVDYAPASGSDNYIWNGTIEQPTSNFNISGGGFSAYGFKAPKLSVGDLNDVDGNGSVWYGLTNRNANGVDLNGYFGLNFNVANGNALTINTNREAIFTSTIQATTAKLTNLFDNVIPVSSSIGLINSGIIYNPSNQVTGIYFGKLSIDGQAGISYGYDINTSTLSGLYFKSKSGFDGNGTTLTDYGNLGLGYSTGTEIANNKLAVNGSGYFNGTLFVKETGTYPSGLIIANRNDTKRFTISADISAVDDGGFTIADQTFGQNRFNIYTDGRVNIPNLSGTGTRLTTALADGTLSTTSTTDFAPASGSGNYIWNQNSNAQSANMWISGNVTANDLTAKGTLLSDFANNVSHKLVFASTEVGEVATNNYDLVIGTTGFGGQATILKNNGIERLRLESGTGNVIISTNVSIPTGTIQATQAKFTTGAAANTLFTGDATGLGSWSTVNQAIGGNTLTSGYLPYWDGSKLVDSELLHTNTGFRITNGVFGRSVTFNWDGDNSGLNLIAEGQPIELASGWNNTITLNTGYEGFNNGSVIIPYGNFTINKLGNGSSTRLVTASSTGQLGGATINEAIGENALTSGYLPYWDGSKLANSNIYTDGLKIAVGTNLIDGNRKITIEGSDNLPSILFRNTTTSSGFYAGVFSIYDGSFAIDENGIANRLLIQKATGNVGIGTINPLTKLHIYKDNTSSRTTIQDIISLEATNTVDSPYDGFGQGIEFRGRSYMNGTIRTLGRIATVLTDNSVDDRGTSIVFQNIPTSSGSDTPVERMRILYNGNVGIGTTTPGAKLNVRGPLGETVGGGGSSIKMTNSDTENYSSISAGIIGIANTGMEFSTDGFSRMVIHGSTGNVGIGTNNPQYKLDVNGAIRTTGTIRSSNTLFIDTEYGSNSDINLRTNAEYGITIKGNGGNVGIGYSSGTEITNNKLAVNGNTLINGTNEIRGVIYQNSNNGADSFIAVGGEVGSHNGMLIGTSAGSTLMQFRLGSYSTATGFPGATFDMVNGDITLNTYQGNTNIGYSVDQGYKLAVNGNVKILNSVYDYQENIDVDSGTEVIAQVPVNSCTAVFFDYVIKNGTNLRAGTITTVHDGSNTEFTEYGTNDIGDTSGVTFSTDISGGYLRLLATTTTNNWIIKAIIRSL